MREHDWSASPLGAPATWPQSLRTVVGLLLQSKFPMFVAWGPELRFLYNDAYAEILGAKHPSALGRRFDAVWSEIWPDIKPLSDAALAGEAIYQRDLQLLMNRHGYDEKAWFTFSYSPVQDESGAVGGMFCAVTETTDRVIVEKRDAFRLSLERQLRDVADPVAVMAAASEALGRELGIARVGYGEIDAAEEHVIVERDWTDGRIGSVAGRYRMDDFGPRIIAEMRAGRVMWVDDVDADPRVGPSAAAFAAIQTRSVLAVPLFKDGRFVAMLYLHHPFPHRWEESEVVLAREVVEQTWQAVERARAEADLRKLNANLEQRVADALAERKLLADIIDGTDIFVQVADLNFNWLAINKASAKEFTRIFGVATPRVGDNMLAMLAHRPEDQAAVREVWSRALAGEEFVETDAFGDPDLDRRYYEMRFRTLRGAEGQRIGAYQFVTDVTERLREQHRLKQAELAQRQADALYRAYFENAPEALFGIGVEPDGGFVVEEINPDHEAGVGFKLAEVRGRRVEEFLPPQTAEKVLEAYRFVVEKEAVYQYREVFELHGEAQHWDTSILPVRDDMGRISRLIGSSRNVTRQVNAEETLRQAQKMEAVGQLSGGLAHDFNNILAGISGSLEVMATRLSQGRIADLDRYISGARGATRRAAALTQRLLAFSRRQTLDPKPTNLNTLVNGMLELITRSVGPSIAVEAVNASGLWATHVDAGQLENALLNLCINARDAMPDGGKLTIETGNRWMDERAARQHNMAPGQYVSLCVSDTGTGMAPEVIERAFDPFFTTKPIGEGTGLGLSMVYGFAGQSGGAVRIYSELGEGTMVCIYLPRHLGEADAAPLAQAQEDTPRANQSETVLLVDDEPLVRMIASEALEELGYNVIEASDGASALKILASSQVIDLLITDVGLPGGTHGRQVADAGRQARPDLKVLFTTGYAENAVLNHGHLSPGMHVMTKPFEMDAFARRVRDLIER